MKQIIETRPSKYNGKYDQMVEITFKYLYSQSAARVYGHQFDTLIMLATINANEPDNVKQITHSAIIGHISRLCNNIALTNKARRTPFDQMLTFISEWQNEVKVYDTILNQYLFTNQYLSHGTCTMRLTNPRREILEAVDSIAEICSTASTVDVTLKTCHAYGEESTVYQKNPKYGALLIITITHGQRTKFNEMFNEHSPSFSDVKWTKQGTNSYNGKLVYVLRGTELELECIRLIFSEFKSKLKYIKPTK